MRINGQLVYTGQTQEKEQDTTMTSLNLDMLKGKTDVAPRIYHTFGQMIVNVLYRVWTGEDGQRSLTDATAEEYAANGGVLEFEFTIPNPAEFNEKLTNPYRRKVSTAAKKYGRDWREIVKPSIVAIVGDGDFAHLIGAVHGKYVQVKDVPQASGELRDNGTPWNTLAFVAIYDSKEQCQAAYDAHVAQYSGGNTGSNGTTPVQPVSTYPAGFTAMYNEKVRGKIAGQIRDMARNGSDHAAIAAEYDISADDVTAIVNSA